MFSLWSMHKGFCPQQVEGIKKGSGVQGSSRWYIRDVFVNIHTVNPWGPYLAHIALGTNPTP